MRRMLFSIPLLSLLVLPLSADEALHGSWEGQFMDEEGNNVTVRLTFKAGGVFEMDQLVQLGEGFQSVVEATQIPVENITASGTGTWEADGDRLRVSIPEMETLVDGRDYLEVLTEVARALAALTAELAGVSEADYPAFEAVFVNDFLSGVSAEEFLPGFADEVTWAIDGDTLSITTAMDGVEETLQYQRVPAGTAVAPTTWGSLKAQGRR